MKRPFEKVTTRSAPKESSKALATHRVPPPWGNPLIESDYHALEKSWITRDIANGAMLRRVDDFEGRQILSRSGSGDYAGIVFPYIVPGECHPCDYRVRRDKPDVERGTDGNLKQKAKYVAPPGSRNKIYFAPGNTALQLKDTQLPIVVTEGEKKALALSRLAMHDCSEKPRFLPIAFSGACSWRGVIGKETAANGERVDEKGPIPDLDRLAWTDRPVIVVFDANTATNSMVQRARLNLARNLKQRGAVVQFVDLPADPGVNGIDDYLALHGPEAALDLIAKATPFRNTVVTPQYFATPDGLCRLSGSGQSSCETQLSNFSATIIRDIRIDDGFEVSREFELGITLAGKLSTIRVSAAEFARMDWPSLKIGAGAIIHANQKEHTRTAIQSLSLPIKESWVLAHTGWREWNNRWIFLHAAGAIGCEGATEGVDVRLPSQLGAYELRLPTDRAELISAVRASLRLLDLGPAFVSFPLLAAVYGAPVAQPDFAVYIVGETGVFKSELAALLQQHYGARMDRQHLPTAWSSTGNAIEVVASQAKDVVLVLDDFAPQGSSAEINHYHATADRVFRGVGNHAGRGRLDSNAQLRPPRVPRCLMISTGEDLPRQQSIQARLLVVELVKGAISSVELSNCQHDARSGMYAVAMAAYLQWLAPRLDEIRVELSRRRERYRAQLSLASCHARTPDILASLQTGFDLFVQFAEEAEAIGSDEGTRLSNCSWEALLAVGNAQASQQQDVDPVLRFLELLRAALASGKAHLKPVCRSLHDHQLTGDCIGWFEGNDLYLQPMMAFRVAQIMSKEIGEILPIREPTLRKRLKQGGYLLSMDSKRETILVRRTIAGHNVSVLHLSRDTVLATSEPSAD